MGTYGTYFGSLSNEEKFVMADVAAQKVENERGSKMTPLEYEEFVRNFIKEVMALKPTE